MNSLQRTISPIDGSLVAERPLLSADEVGPVLVRARDAAAAWRRTPIAERVQLVLGMVDALVARRAELADEITLQMGRPIRSSPGEISGLAERARYMAEIAPEALADVDVGNKAGFSRFIRREPLGVVLTVAPWNYPYLTAVNSVVPALLAGNVVILKHSAQTPLCAERMAEAAVAAGIPPACLQVVHCAHDVTAALVRSSEIDFVAFTGSVEGGHAVQRAASERFIATGLELGGKDPAYVRADAPFDYTLEQLVDGAFFNSGQSCCGVERIYVERSLYADFVEAFSERARRYTLGDPRHAETTLGPLVRTAAADHVRGQIAGALAAGARALVDEAAFVQSVAGTPYLAPQVLVDVNHGMPVMTEETFGPVVGIMPVSGDEEAIQLMNDSRYGLTASVWTTDAEAALAVGESVETGTWFMNRCDVLDPALAWTGVKDSGRGCTLSRVGFESLTRPKSFHLKLQV